MTGKLIALYSSIPQSGKSTVADYLVEKFDFDRVKFAEPLKDMTRVLLRHATVAEDMIERYVEGDLKEDVIPELGITCRRAQQTLGTEWGRDIVRADLWVHLACLKVQRLLALGRDVVIDDMRFPNEFQAVHQMGGVPVRVYRTGRAGHHDSHCSEGALDKAPMRAIVNAGTIAELRVDVARLVGDLSAS